jgi:hypothetical protein
VRVPVPENRLVAFTLAGALLTAIVAGALAVPGDPTHSGERADATGASQQVGTAAPTPNQEFTPAVQTQSGYEDEEHGEYEDHDERENYDEHEDGEEDELPE